MLFLERKIPTLEGKMSFLDRKTPFHQKHYYRYRKQKRRIVLQLNSSQIINVQAFQGRKTM